YIGCYLWPLCHLVNGFRKAAQMDPRLQRSARANLVAAATGLVVLSTSLVMNIGEFTFYNWELLGFSWAIIGVAMRAADVMRGAVAPDCLRETGLRLARGSFVAASV